MRQVPTLSALFLILTLLFPVMSSCQQGHDQKEQADTPPAWTDTTFLRLALTPSAENLPFYMAERLGLFEQCGVSVLIETYAAAADCDTSFTGISADAISTDLVKAQRLYANGFPLRITSATDMTLFLLTSRQARILKPESMKEKVIAISRHSASDFFLDQTVNNAKMESEQVNKPQINNLRLRSQMLDQNQYDGAILPEPYATLSETNGAHRIASTQDPPAALGAVCFKQAFIERRAADVEHFYQAYDMAVDSINAWISHRRTLDLMAILPAGITINDTAAADTLLRIDLFNHASAPSTESMEQTLKWAKGRKLIINQADFKDMIIAVPRQSASK